MLLKVDWNSNLRKPVLGQKWVGFKLRNQSGLEDAMYVIITFKTTRLDSPNTSSQSNTFEIICHVSSSIMGRRSIISSTASSSITPQSFHSLLPSASPSITLKTSALPSFTSAGLLLVLYTIWIELALFAFHVLWNHACYKEQAATCVPNLVSLVLNLQIYLQNRKLSPMKYFHDAKHILH